MNPPIKTSSPVCTIMRVERFTALEMAPASGPVKQKPTAAATAHPAPERKRLIFGKRCAAGENSAGLRRRLFVGKKTSRNQTGGLLCLASRVSWSPPHNPGLSNPQPHDKSRFL